MRSDASRRVLPARVLHDASEALEVGNSLGVRVSHSPFHAFNATFLETMAFDILNLLLRRCPEFRAATFLLRVPPFYFVTALDLFVQTPLIFVD